MRILLTGINGQVGWELHRTLVPLGQVIALNRSQMDLANVDGIRKAIRNTNPDIIVNAAAYTAVDRAETEPDLAMLINGIAPGVMAEEAKRIGALFVHYSTDYVFDGTLGKTYTEVDEPNPLNVYGISKLEGERNIAATGCAHVILRTSWIYSAFGPNFMLTILKLAREQNEITVVTDQIGSPTWARALAESTRTLLSKADRIKSAPGIYHFSATGHASRFDFAQQIIATAKQISGTSKGWASLRAIPTDKYALPATRPLNVVICQKKIKTSFGIEMAGWTDQLQACMNSMSIAAGWRFDSRP